MNKYAHQLDIKNIMQGLEEFAHFMSFQSSGQSHLRILSVETITAPENGSTTPAQNTAKVIAFPHRADAEDQLIVKKSLSFHDNF